MEWYFCSPNYQCWSSWFGDATTAAWAQAIATFMAVLVALIIPRRQNLHDKRLREKEKSEARDNALLIVVAAMEQIFSTMDEMESDLAKHRRDNLLKCHMEMLRSAREILANSPFQEVGRREVADMALRIVRVTASLQVILSGYLKPLGGTLPYFTPLEPQDERAWQAIELAVIRTFADVRGAHKVINFFADNRLSAEIAAPEFRPLSVYSSTERMAEMSFLFLKGRWSVICTVTDASGRELVNSHQLCTTYSDWWEARKAGIEYADNL